MSWKQSGIASPVFSELTKFVENCEALFSSTSRILSVASEALDIVKELYVAESDPIAAVMATITAEIQNFMNDTFATGVHTLVINPFKKEQKYIELPGVIKKQVDKVFAEAYIPDLKTDEFGYPKLTPIEAIDLAVESFYDTGDPDRPIFSDDATVGAYGIMVTSVSVDIFADILGVCNSIFSIPEFEYILKKVNLIRSKEEASTNPDWQKQALNSYEPLGKVQRTLDDFLQITLGYLNPKTSAVEDLIDLIIDKIDELNGKIQDLAQLLNDLKNATDATGLWVFKLAPQVGGTLSIENALYDNEFYSLSENKYTAFALFVGGGPSLRPIEIIQELLG